MCCKTFRRRKHYKNSRNTTFCCMPVENCLLILITSTTDLFQYKLQKNPNILECTKNLTQLPKRGNSGKQRLKTPNPGHMMRQGVSLLPPTQYLVILRENGKEILYQNLKCTCTAIVLLLNLSFYALCEYLRICDGELRQYMYKLTRVISTVTCRRVKS